MWRQDFTFDRYGNRNLNETDTTTIPKNCGGAICTADRYKFNPAINTSNNNRMDSGQGYTYDSAGNTLTDANGQKFTYDGENKQTEVKNSSNATIGLYYYDGDGKRVKKIAGDETTIFVYDAGGKQIAEYSTVVASVEDAKVAYLTADHLGSPRINTDRDGNVVTRHDYHPFGEEIVTAQRATHDEYTPDSVRKQFTGYERDDDSSLDFAQARYYSNQLGRFVSVDPLMASADIMNPQTFNRYVYVGNNPVNITDPTGEIWGVNGSVIQWFDGALGKGFTEYTLLFAYRTGTNQLVALSSTANVATNVADAAEWLAKVVGDGEAAGAVGASAAALGIPLAIAQKIVMDTLDPDGRYRTGMDLPEPVREFRGTQPSYLEKMMNQMSQTKSGEADTSSPSGGSTPATPNPKDLKPQQSPSSAKDMKKLSPGEARKFGEKEDIHKLKGQGGGKYDLYKDKQGNIYIVRMGGKGEPYPTNHNIKNY